MRRSGPGLVGVLLSLCTGCAEGGSAAPDPGDELVARAALRSDAQRRPVANARSNRAAAADADRQPAAADAGRQPAAADADCFRNAPSEVAIRGRDPETSSGTGPAYCGGPQVPVPPPLLRAARRDIAVVGSMDREIVRRYLRRVVGDLTRCVDDDTNRVEIDFEIDRVGLVHETHARGTRSRKQARCLEARVSKLRFPPDSPGITKVSVALARR